ncbi:lytic transglycosylase domain-containing protein, partial [Candidatus Pelagibacter sp.]|nr:lytic transglycosylase domain-containing protein [Candidatus Pelagibacter sp.]
MLKKLLLFIGLLISITIIQNNVLADIISSIPLKKPTLTFEELDKKITKNILKPIKKPKKIDKTTIKEKEITQSEKKTKLSFKIPKKK